MVIAIAVVAAVVLCLSSRRASPASAARKR